MLTQSPGTSPYDRYATEPYIYSVWHDSMVMPVFGGKHRRTTALTSQHRDGSFVAGVLKARRITTVRGSTSRISITALKKLLRTVDSRNLVITPDGPRGPNRVVSSGIAYLASRSGRAVVPTGFACSNCWRWKGTWSTLIVPKPFSTVVLLAGRPLHVPPEIDKSELSTYVAQIQTAMEELDHEAQIALEAKLDVAPTAASTR